MESYGIQENFLRWIAKWLENRKQRVQDTDWVDRGPFLFTIFIDDRGDEVLCEIFKFADDAKITS